MPGPATVTPPYGVTRKVTGKLMKSRLEVGVEGAIPCRGYR